MKEKSNGYLIPLGLLSILFGLYYCLGTAAAAIFLGLTLVVVGVNSDGKCY